MDVRIVAWLKAQSWVSVRVRKSHRARSGEYICWGEWLEFGYLVIHQKLLLSDGEAMRCIVMVWSPTDISAVRVL